MSSELNKTEHVLLNLAVASADNKVRHRVLMEMLIEKYELNKEDYEYRVKEVFRNESESLVREMSGLDINGEVIIDE